MLWGLIGSLFVRPADRFHGRERIESEPVIRRHCFDLSLWHLSSAGGFTPLQTLYAVECLENRTRAKGSGLNYLFLNIAMVVNTYGISVGIQAIGWKLYLV